MLLLCYTYHTVLDLMHMFLWYFIHHTVILYCIFFLFAGYITVYACISDHILLYDLCIIGLLTWFFPTKIIFKMFTIMSHYLIGDILFGSVHHDTS